MTAGRAYAVPPGRAIGSVRAPPSKSYTHRELVVSFLADGPSTLVGPLVSEDTMRTRIAMQRLGARISGGPLRWRVIPPTGEERARGKVTLECGRSGTTLRFLAGLAAVVDREIELRADPELARRPIGPLLEFLEAGGAEVRRPRGHRGFPIRIHGPVQCEAGAVRSSESSQFASALLLALPARRVPSRLTLQGAWVSAPYIATTLDVLRGRGVRWTRRGRSFRAPGGQRIRGRQVEIPGDASSASYLWAAGAISGGTVEVRGVPLDRPQADLRILPILRRMGAVVTVRPGGVSVGGSVARGIRVDLTDAPDLFPLVGVLAACARSPSVLRGARHAAWKESDRRAETLRLVRHFGGSATYPRHALRIVPANPVRPWRGTLPADHRVVMSAAVGAIRAGGTIGPPEAVRKSYPTFWRDLRRLGIACVPRRT